MLSLNNCKYPIVIIYNTKEHNNYESIGLSPTEFKTYFRDSETGRGGGSMKSEQSKKAMPFSAKSMIQKYLKSKMES
jgi:hypothetical protein